MKLKYTPYSAAKFKVFDECKLKFKYKYVDRVKVPFLPKIAFEKGKFFHSALEYYPNKPSVPFNFVLSNSRDIQSYAIQLKQILANPSIQQLISDHNSQRELWFKIREDNTTMFTGQIDYFNLVNKNTAIIIDWKTGKRWGKDGSIQDPQVLLYALWAFKEHPTINTVEASYYYIEQDDKVTYVYDRKKDCDNIADDFSSRINIIESEENFPKTEHRFCRYCDYQDKCLQEI